MAIEIRVLTPDDVSALWNLRLEALESEGNAFSSSVEDHRLLAEDEFRARFSSNAGNRFAVGAFQDGRLVGMAGFVRERGLKERHKGRIWGVYLNASVRGKGIGRQLLNALLERTTTCEGLEQIVLSVATTQSAASALYRSLGFVPFGREPRALKVGDNYIDEEYMVLHLKRAVE